MPLIDDLYVYYEEKGILATRFTCTYQDECCGALKRFTGPKSAYLGERFENARSLGLPRLVFVSLDSGSGETNPANRLPDRVRRQMIEEGVGRRNRHWYRTHELAACIFNRILGTCMTPRQAQPYFAHVNFAKCCQNNPGRRQANAKLFKNCRPYLSGELEILSPDVIVTQGVLARTAVSSVVGCSLPEFQFTCRPQLVAREVFWLHTHHPSAFGRFNLQRRQWGDFAEEIKRLVDEWGTV